MRAVVWWARVVVRPWRGEGRRSLGRGLVSVELIFARRKVVLFLLRHEREEKIFFFFLSVSGI